MSGKKKAKRAKVKAENRYRGFLPAAIFLALFSAILAIIYIMPAPRAIPQNARPPFEEFGKGHPPPVPVQPAHRPMFTEPSRPLVAIIIDDMGYDFSIDEAFLRLDAPVSYAFLPFAPNTEKLARQAASAGRDVLVHLPMEPKNGAVNPGPGVLRVEMPFNELVSALKKDLQAVPFASGVNNHMGSRFTEDRKAMEIVLAEVARRGMFFIDSRTTAGTVAYDVAREMGVPAGWRSVFLDHDPSRKAIRHELERLESLAFKHGQAIAIGHPLKSTLKVLYRELPKLRKRVKIVPVHILVKAGNTLK